MVDSPDALIEEYLERLRQVTLVLPRQTRNELLMDIGEHLQAGMDERPRTVAEVRNLLNELGTPEEITAAALDQQTAAAGRSPAPEGTPPVLSLLLSIAAVALTWIAWPVGVLCLWLSDAWTTRQKWLGTLVLPGGIWIPYAAPVLLPWGPAAGKSAVVSDLITAGFWVALLAPIAVAVYLGVVLIRGRVRRSARS